MADLTNSHESNSIPAENRFRYPAESFEWTNYLRRPWRLRWRLRSIPAHFGQEFQDFYVSLGKSLYWDQEQINHNQWVKIKAVIDHAYHTVPFYKRWFGEKRITPADIRNWDDFRLLPIINRTNLDENLADFTSSQFQEHRGSPAQTSGSTGRLLRFYRSWNTESFRRAVLWRHFNLIGYHFKQPRVSLNIPFSDAEYDLLYKYEPIDNLVAFNGRLIHTDTVRAFDSVIRKFRPQMFYSHPSALVALAKAMENADLPSLNLPVVYLYSEVITPPTLSLIKRLIGHNVFDHYGNRENSISASQLHCGNYHINSEFVYTELVPSNEEFDGEKLSRVIGTNLINYAMPVIRYDCRDLASTIENCDKCAIAHPIIRFVGGREKNFLLSKKGLLHCQYDDVLNKHNVEMPEDLQVEQIDLENLVLRMVPGKHYNRERDEPTLVHYLHESTKGWFKVTVEYVDVIPPTKGFKKSKVLSRLGNEYVASGRQ